jgi:hypothetical protein
VNAKLGAPSTGTALPFASALAHEIAETIYAVLRIFKMGDVVVAKYLSLVAGP